MIGFLFFLALQPISRKTECHVNLCYVQVVYMKLSAQKNSSKLYTVTALRKCWILDD